MFPERHVLLVANLMGPRWAELQIFVIRSGFSRKNAERQAPSKCSERQVAVFCLPLGPGRRRKEEQEEVEGQEARAGGGCGQMRCALHHEQ